MIFIDHIISYLMEGGKFLEINVDATILGVVLLIAVL